MVQTGQPATVPVQLDDPLQYLLSDSDDSDEVRQECLVQVCKLVRGLILAPKKLPAVCQG